MPRAGDTLVFGMANESLWVMGSVTSALKAATSAAGSTTMSSFEMTISPFALYAASSRDLPARTVSSHARLGEPAGKTAPPVGAMRSNEAQSSWLRMVTASNLRHAKSRHCEQWKPLKQLQQITAPALANRTPRLQAWLGRRRRWQGATRRDCRRWPAWGWHCQSPPPPPPPPRPTMPGVSTGNETGVGLFQSDTCSDGREGGGEGKFKSRSTARLPRLSSPDHRHWAVRRLRGGLEQRRRGGGRPQQQQPHEWQHAQHCRRLVRPCVPVAAATLHGCSCARWVCTACAAGCARARAARGSTLNFNVHARANTAVCVQVM